MSIYAEATHGVALQNNAGKEKYFGWPSVAKLADGTVVTGASGLRRGHVCPWGRSVVAYSKDGGETYGPLQVAHNDMIDNRDLGVVALGGQSYAITWFSTDIRIYDLRRYFHSDEDYNECMEIIGKWDDDTANSLSGSWIKITPDGGQTWTRAISVPVSAPHGFSVMPDGTLGYLGRGYTPYMKTTGGDIEYVVSRDGGFTWEIVGKVPLPHDIKYYHEPHVIGLDDGSLLGVIRHEMHDNGYDVGDTCITRSYDGGKTWTVAEQMHVGGYPPHLLKHSSGTIVMVYGYRRKPYGERAVVSWDNGKTWSDEIIIRDDAVGPDLGYPCSIELDDGSIYTVYYSPVAGNSNSGGLWVENTIIEWSRWKLPERK